MFVIYLFTVSSHALNTGVRFAHIPLGQGSKNLSYLAGRWEEPEIRREDLFAVSYRGFSEFQSRLEIYLLFLNFSLREDHNAV